jgi:hypothetical protein
MGKHRRRQAGFDNHPGRFYNGEGHHFSFSFQDDVM